MFRKFFAELCGMCAEFPFNIRLLEKWGARGDQPLGSVGMGSGARAHREVLSDGLELVAEVVVGVALGLELGQHEGQGLPQDPLRPHRRGVRRLRQNTQRGSEDRWRVGGRGRQTLRKAVTTASENDGPPLPFFARGEQGLCWRLLPRGGLFGLWAPKRLPAGPPSAGSPHRAFVCLWRSMGGPCRRTRDKAKGPWGLLARCWAGHPPPKRWCSLGLGKTLGRKRRSSQRPTRRCLANPLEGGHRLVKKMATLASPLLFKLPTCQLIRA